MTYKSWIKEISLTLTSTWQVCTDFYKAGVVGSGSLLQRRMMYYSRAFLLTNNFVSNCTDHESFRMFRQFVQTASVKIVGEFIQKESFHKSSSRLMTHRSGTNLRAFWWRNYRFFRRRCCIELQIDLRRLITGTGGQPHLTHPDAYYCIQEKVSLYLVDTASI